MYILMYGHTCSKSVDPPMGNNDYSLSPFASKNLISRNRFGSPVLRQSVL